MIKAIDKYFPNTVKYTKPNGGMFIWVTLLNNKRALDVFNSAITEKVAFVPGDPFYVDGRIANTMRLNYTNATSDMIEEGIKRIAKIL